MDQPRIIGIIGARSGSKSVRDKNIKLLAGKPLMAWIIEAAKRSRYLERVIVSTDSEQYAAIARQFGAETPFLRPAEISGDRATDFEYVRHAVDWLQKNERYDPDIVVRMMPTVPLQATEDVDGCIEKLISDPDAHASVVVAEAGQHPHKAMKLVEENGKQYLVHYATGKARDAEPTFRQGLERAYFRANVVASRRFVVTDLHSLVGDKIRAHIIPKERAVDIDSPIDFLVVEHLMRFFGKKDARSELS